MPELPEVETTRRGIGPHVEGKRVKRLVIRQPSLRWPIPDDLPSLVKGEKVLSVTRRGKYLLLGFAGGTAIIHLGMSGSLRIIEADEPPMAHDHVDWQFDDGSALRYTDPRRFGCLLWQAGNEPEEVLAHSLLADLGPEPLSSAFDGEWLYQRSRKRKIPVKTLLMDSKVVVGVGNIYANEALFAAGVHPTKAAGKVTRAQYQRLAEAAKAILAEAINRGGTTLKDFVGGDGKPGYFKQELQVYGRGGQPCKSCQRPLKEVRLAQRTTVYCPKCQG